MHNQVIFQGKYVVTQALHNSPERLQRLVEINQKISATLDLPELLQSIVNAASELTESQQASIAQFFPKDQTLRFVAAKWMDADIMENTRIPLDGSISGKAFQQRKAVIVHNAQKEDFYRKVDEDSGFQTRSVLSVPLMMRGEAKGVLSALNKHGGAEYDVQDIIVLETLASQAAIALENARLLRESRQAYARLAELDEMKNNFVAISSHELRIPLGLILGHASYLKESLNGEHKDQVEVIERSALRLKEIVEDLSVVENIKGDTDELRSNYTDLSDLLRKNIAEFGSEAQEKGIMLIPKLPDDHVWIFGEQDKLGIAFKHLIRNAIAFTDKGGKVELLLRKNAKKAQVFVSDTGIGIPEKDLEDIFERFYQVEEHMTRRHGGMGLGLTVAKSLIELHKGEIEVESVQGKGTRFEIRLPLTQPK